MKFLNKWFFIVGLASIATVFAVSARGQALDVYGQTTTRLLLPVAVYTGTNTLNPTLTVGSYQQQPNPINANQTNSVLVDTNYQYDVQHYIGRCNIALSAAVTNGAAVQFQVISSNTVYGNLITNQIIIPAGTQGQAIQNLVTNLPFDTTANGRYLWYNYQITGSTNSAILGATITGRLKDQ